MSLSIYTHLMCGYLKTFNATGVHGVFLVLLSMAMHIFSCVPELLPVRVESTLARGSPEKTKVKIIGERRDVGGSRNTFNVFR